MPSPKDPRRSEGVLPDHIIQDLFPRRTSTDNTYRHTIGAIPLAGPDNRPVHGIYQAGLQGSSAGQFAETGSNYTSLWGRWGTTVHGVEDDTYSLDEDKQSLKVHRDMPMNQISIENLIKKHDQGIPQAHRPSNDSSRDVEKADPHSQELDRMGQGAGNKRQTQWENDVVGWDGPNDPQNPHNWKKSKKYIVTVLYASLTFCITFSSSIFSTATEVTAELYGVSNEVMTLGTSLVVFVSSPSLASLMSHWHKWTGFRRGPNYVGSLLRTLRSKVTSVHRILRLRHLPNPRRCCPKCWDDHVISVLGRCVWICTAGDSRRNTSGFLGSCWKGFRPWPLRRRDVHRTRSRTDYRGLHHPELLRMEVDGLDHLDYGRLLWTTGIIYMWRVVCATATTAQGGKDTLRDQELGNTCPRGRESNQRETYRQQVPSSSFHHDGARAHTCLGHYIHVHHLRNSLPLLRSLPNRLWGSARLERRCRLPSIPRHHDRCDHWCRHHYVHIQHAVQAENDSQRREADTRGEADSHDRRGLPTTHWPLLVRMDIKSTHFLGTAGPRGYTYRSRSAVDLFARNELHHRRLPHECQQRSRSQHTRAIFGRWRVPTFRHCHVP